MFRIFLVADLERYDEAMLFMQTAGRMSPKRFPSAEEDATKLQWKAVQKQNQIEQECVLRRLYTDVISFAECVSQH